MKILITLLCLMNGLFFCSAQEKNSENKKFNQKIADSLGADNYGMKSYKIIILKTGAKDKEITDKTKRAELFKKPLR